MSIKKRLLLILILPVLSVMVFSLLFWYSYSSNVQMKTDVTLYDGIMEDVHDLSLLNNNILLYGAEKRTMRQWYYKLGLIQQKLQHLNRKSEDNNLEFIKSEYTKMHLLFNHFNKSYQDPNSSSRYQYQKRLIGQIQIHLYNVVTGIQGVIKYVRLQRLEQEQERETLMFAGIISLSVLNTVMIWYLIISIVRPLEYLQKRVAQIADGKFNTTIELESKDEFGDFSRVLQKMTFNFLSAIEQLHIEIDQRKANEVSLEKMNQQLVELDRLKTIFIASMSHELRTPLNAIIGFSCVLKSGMTGELNDKQIGYLNRIDIAGRNLLAMIIDVIDISKLESGNLPFIAGKFSLKELLEDLLKENEENFRKKGMESRLLIDEDIYLCTDRTRLKQSIGNYLSNALKFSEKGSVTICVRRNDNDIEIEVSDEGIGIEENDIGKIFKPFERLESRLKVIAGGAGLGLYLTKKMVTELMGGEVYVKSSPEKGSTFGLRIPVECRDVIKGEKNDNV